MTTEGDGNYHLQRFLEQEGAECDIQFVTNWLLFMLWEGRYDTKLRAELRGLDSARKSLKDGKIGKKLVGLFVADLAIRAAFHTFGAAIGYRGYNLPDMDEVAETAHQLLQQPACAAAKATWRWASSSSTCCTTRRT